MLNDDLRITVQQNGLKLWQVANQVGIADSTFSRWLRTPLQGERREKVLKAIEELLQASES